jgi:hypothetical protein
VRRLKEDTMKAIQWYTLIMSIAALVINIHTFILQNKLYKRIMRMRRELTPTVYDFEKLYEESKNKKKVVYDFDELYAEANERKVDLSKKDII